MQIRNERFASISWKDVMRIPEALAAGCGADAPGLFAAWLSRQVPMHAFVVRGSGMTSGTWRATEVFVRCLSKTDLFRRVVVGYNGTVAMLATKLETK